MDSTVDITATPVPAPKVETRDVKTDDKPRRTDKHIWGIYIALCVISVVELYSASSHEVTESNIYAPILRHVMFLLAGLVIMLALQRTHYKHFYKWIWVFAIASVVMMLLTMMFGERINGATRSISVMGLPVQPTEMVKLSAPLVIAAILCKEQMKGVSDVTTKGVVLSTACVLIGGAMLFADGLTNTLLLMGISLSMMLIGGVSMKKFFRVILVFIVAGCLGLMVKAHSSGFEAGDPTTEAVAGSHSDGRMGTWTNRLLRHNGSEKYKLPITNENRQELFSYMAQAHGGILGVLPGNSRETARLPLAFSDYIYAIIIEELGLIGGIVVLILYLWLLARAGRIAYRCQTAFPALLVIGMAVFIVYQAIFHMAIVTGVFPVSGQPLPLISKGGTSIIIVSIALGIMLSVSRFAARKGIKAEIKDEIQELKDLPSEARAVNPT